MTRANDAYAYTGHYNVDRGYGSNGLNQYTSAGTTAFAYDQKGNLTASGTTTYSYTTLGQLAGSNAGANYLEYGSLENLQGYNTPGGFYPRFANDGDNMVSEFTHVPSGTSYRTARHVFVPGSDEPLVSYDASGARRFLSADERGSVTAVTDSAGGVLAINRYDEYGIPASGNLGRFQYTGQAWIAELGMYHYKARMYSPTLGRFLQTDPIGYGDGLNWYNYVGSDPINRVDPTGLQASRIAEDRNAVRPYEITVSHPPLPDRLDELGKVGIPVWSSLFRPLTMMSPIFNPGESASPDVASPADDEIVVAAHRKPQTMILAAQRGGQNQRATEFRNLTDEQVQEAYDKAKGEQKVKLQRELKARGLHGGGKVRGGGIFRSFPLIIIPNIDLQLLYLGCVTGAPDCTA